MLDTNSEWSQTWCANIWSNISQKWAEINEVNSLINVCLRKDFIDGLSTEREETLVNNNLSKIDNWNWLMHGRKG
jgi:hypothetical protein